MSPRVAVIGGGVAATSVIHWLKTLRPLDKIVQYSCENLAPSASLKSTAVAALRGTQRGLSELGDELCDHWEFSDKFYAELNNPGLIEGELETWLYEDKDLRRFAHLSESSSVLLKAQRVPLKRVTEKCWLIDPQTFMSSFDQSHEKIEGLITQLTPSGSKWRVHTQNTEREFDGVLLCTGVWARWMKDFYPQGELESLRPSQGSFYQWNNFTLGERSFALSFSGLNLHYRHDLHSLQLGATTIKDVDSFIPSITHLEEIKKVFEQTLDLKLDFSQATIHTGIRSILKSRRPFAGKLSENLYGMNGLYKNGWISAWPLAKKLCSTFG